MDWNAELLRADLGQAVRQLKQQPGRGLFVAGTQDLKLVSRLEFGSDAVAMCYEPGRWISLHVGLVSEPYDETLEHVDQIMKLCD